MPPRQSPPGPSGPQRRRQNAGLTSGWVWLVIVGMALFIIWLMSDLAGAPTIDFSDFLKLVQAQKLSKAVFVGNDRILAELKDAADLPSDIKNPEDFKKGLH